ncbi:DNA polymerase [Salmonella phage fmb-p1]|uniref:DNA polymerase n=1 Tax=Salmonella phage fmb-p1 TaxID=2849081 RepID=A0A8F2JFH7_9CAUD|nr:DNA polymerase [Salmonella phage fmb-p1]QWT71892.1 DNA polymerase [Salmonella phage fmb-p1]
MSERDYHSVYNVFYQEFESPAMLNNWSVEHKEVLAYQFEVAVWFLQL